MTLISLGPSQRRDDEWTGDVARLNTSLLHNSMVFGVVQHTCFVCKFTRSRHLRKTVQTDVFLWATTNKGGRLTARGTSGKYLFPKMMAVSVSRCQKSFPMTLHDRFGAISET